jgi:cellulose synthase/poly-beta-1,6-N-acetylglucosamine synthase-like glycosyltransferase
MNIMLEKLFWFLILILIYIFFGYPFLLKCLFLLKPSRASIDDKYTPSVSIILSVYNEEGIIREKIKNFLSLDYPQGLLEMVIISDNCTDKTEEFIKSFNCSRIKLLVQERRSGKTPAINRGVSVAKGDVLVFTDANSILRKDAVMKLVRHFSDPRIGLVSGRSIYLDSQRRTEEVSGLYRKYEESIKRSEGRVSSIVGADGAIYALRRELFEPLNPNYINDFIHPIQVVLKGYRAINETEAICTEIIDETNKDELRRQTRIMAQSWLIYFSQIGRLIEKKKWVYAWEFTSHKFLRWITLPIMFLLFIVTIILFKQGALFQWALLLQIIFFLSVVFGWRDSKIKWLRFSYFFFLIHFSALLGLYNFLSGNVYVTWNPRDN